MSGDEPSPSLREQTQRFLSEFFAKGEELVRDLILENERLRQELAGDIPVTPTTPVVLQRLVRQVEELERECGEIRKLAGSMQEQSGDYHTRLDDLEREHYHLAAMYVAGNQFHTAATIDDVLRTITEILLNFVGVGRFTVYGVDEERQVAFPMMREGADLSECSELALSSEGAPEGSEAAPLAEVVAPSGPWRVGGSLAAADGTLMHLPLVSGTRLVGVARIESFLPQKSEFVDTDFSLLELVSEHAGIGIETAWIRAHAREVPMQRGAVEGLVRG